MRWANAVRRVRRSWRKATLTLRIIDPPNSLLLFFVLCSSLSFFFHVIDRRTPSPALTLFPLLSSLFPHRLRQALTPSRRHVQAQRLFHRTANVWLLFPTPRCILHTNLSMHIMHRLRVHIIIIYHSLGSRPANKEFFENFLRLRLWAVHIYERPIAGV